MHALILIQPCCACCRSRAYYNSQQEAEYQRQIQTLTKISRAYGNVGKTVKPTSDELKAKSQWLDSEDLVAFVDQVIKSAEADVKAFLDGTISDEDAGEAAIRVRDAVWAALSYGYLPPLRASCLYTALLPTWGTGCSHLGCHVAGCHGNRLTRELTVEGPAYTLSLPHHKAVKTSS